MLASCPLETCVDTELVCPVLVDLLVLGVVVVAVGDVLGVVADGVEAAPCVLTAVLGVVAFELLVDRDDVASVLVLGESTALSMALFPDSIALDPVCFVLSTAWSTLGVRQKSSHKTSHTSAASTRSDTMAHIILPTIDTRFSSYIRTSLCLSGGTIAE